ncbi:hypothetical protein [Prochlorococcus marinus]|uniref:Uncharacterized protein n=1 Tax=Prochlorococcus marinus (strain MIT 9211) TaxID=93059 RepID=A9B9P4_PROM4|nr:hypothetical protein [Prochlorococcus marinus]ABX08556.1 Hypothetical protein P9211_06251 [Prochlorococcus marinus str. MIT 9211]
MNDENWKEEFKQLKTNLKPLQIRLLEEGAKSQSQALMLNDMWCEWKDLASKKKLNEPSKDPLAAKDPWDDVKTEIISPYG